MTQLPCQCSGALSAGKNCPKDDNTFTLSVGKNCPEDDDAVAWSVFCCLVSVLLPCQRVRTVQRTITLLPCQWVKTVQRTMTLLPGQCSVVSG